MLFFSGLNRWLLNEGQMLFYNRLDVHVAFTIYSEDGPGNPPY